MQNRRIIVWLKKVHKTTRLIVATLHLKEIDIFDGSLLVALIPSGACAAMGGGGGFTVRKIRRIRTIAPTIMKCLNTLVGSVPIINNPIIWPASDLTNEQYYDTNLTKSPNCKVF